MSVPNYDAVARSLAQIKNNLRVALSSTAVVGVLGFATLALNARALSVGEIGSLTTVQAYVALIGGVLTFATYVPMMRFGTAAVERGDIHELHGLIRLALRLDLLGGVTAALVTLLVATIGGEALGISPAVRNGLLFYVPALLFSGLLSSIGMLRLTHRFETIRAVEVGNALAMASAAAILWALHAPLEFYFLSYAIFWGAAPLVRYFVARAEISRQFPKPGADLSLPRSKRGEFVKFAVSGSVGTAMDNIRNTLDVVVASHLFTSEIVGIYGVAKRLAGIFRKFAQFSSTVSFVEITRLVERGQIGESRHLYRHIVLISTGIGLAAIAASVIAGRFALTYAFGPAYAAGYAIFVILVVAVAIQFIYTPVFMYVQVLRGATKALMCNIAGLGAFAVLVTPLVILWGAEGLATALAAFIGASLLCGLLLVPKARVAGAVQ